MILRRLCRDRYSVRIFLHWTPFVLLLAIFVLLLAIGTDAADAKNTACLSSECPQIAVFGKVLPVFECLSLYCLKIRPFTNGHKNWGCPSFDCQRWLFNKTAIVKGWKRWLFWKTNLQNAISYSTKLSNVKCQQNPRIIHFEKILIEINLTIKQESWPFENTSCQ